jgi:DMSO/TMAO reductase YedYZ molybdopterin-dependent catalytic subunit
MPEPFVSRGFVGKRREAGDKKNRIPPGQYLTNDFPVLSAGPTPRIRPDEWMLSLSGLVKTQQTWSWEEFLALPAREFVVDISCVTKWTHLDMHWKGVSMDTLFEQVELEPEAAFATAFSYGGYTTNLPIADLLNNQAFIAYEYDGRALAPDHGGPARLVVPHLYFWKSAKWVRGLNLMDSDRAGFWESLGYHNRGDPWKEQRYQGD